MLESNSRQIGSRGFTYHVTQMGSKRGLAVLTRSIKVLGPVFGQLVSGEIRKGLNGQPTMVDGASFARAMTELALRLNDADREFIQKEFGDFTQITPASEPDVRLPLTFAKQDLHFGGAYAEFFAWMAFCYEVNAGDFSEGLPIVEAIKSAVQGAVSPGQSQSGSPQASTGESGESSAANTSG